MAMIVSTAKKNQHRFDPHECSVAIIEPPRKPVRVAAGTAPEKMTWGLYTMFE
jgi:hypothetical protein